MVTDLMQLFCQNLSLFAKLFLENKSVCYDLTSFNYYLLVYTAPTTASSPPREDQTNPQQVIGFFSKEKMSWDNNNLACILVFPPWQKKGLGKILMGVSYELSRREGRIGGPEKRKSPRLGLAPLTIDAEKADVEARARQQHSRILASVGTSPSGPPPWLDISSRCRSARPFPSRISPRTPSSSLKTSSLR